MSPQGRAKLRGLLMQHEGYRQFPYTDMTGHLTIGYGRNLSDRGITPNESAYLLDEDIDYFQNKLNHFLPFFRDLSEPRQIALIDLCFNVGVQGFLNFRRMIVALEARDYARAAHELMDSHIAPERRSTLAAIISTGQMH